MAYKSVETGYSFSSEFSTWIIAYCLDANSWFCTSQRFFYYEFTDEFQCENDAINYFENHVKEFVELNREMYPKKVDGVFLENTKKWYT